MYKEVLARGGHSTYRIYLLNPTAEDPHATIAYFSGHGFGVEYDVPRLLTIDIPPSVLLEPAEALLFEGVDSGRWELQEGYRANDP